MPSALQVKFGLSLKIRNKRPMGTLAIAWWRSAIEFEISKLCVCDPRTTRRGDAPCKDFSHTRVNTPTCAPTATYVADSTAVIAWSMAQLQAEPGRSHALVLAGSTAYSQRS
jgi:hypothetical protein